MAETGLRGREATPPGADKHANPQSRPSTGARKALGLMVQKGKISQDTEMRRLTLP